MVRMRFEGGQELAAALNTLSGSLSRKVLIEALKEVAEPMRSRMARLAPREPGAPDLADNIVISTTRSVGETVSGLMKGEREAAVAVGPERSFFYGFFQEFSTVHHAAQPFARPGFDGEAPKAIPALAAILWRELAARGISRIRSVGASPSGGAGSRLL